MQDDHQPRARDGAAKHSGLDAVFDEIVEATQAELEAACRALHRCQTDREAERAEWAARVARLEAEHAALRDRLRDAESAPAAQPGVTPERMQREIARRKAVENRLLMVASRAAAAALRPDRPDKGAAAAPDSDG